MKKTSVTKAADITREWHLIDLKGQTLGRAASRIAQLLIGKHKPYFTQQLDCGDYVVVINAQDVAVTGKKRSDKMYRHHTGFPGGFREFTFDQVMEKDPKKIITQAVSGMLPKNKLRNERLRRLKVFVDATHPYETKLSSPSQEAEE